MQPVICPAYLPNIAYLSWALQQSTVYFEVSGNYQKQTYRNRALIYGANGKITLSIPIEHTKNVKNNRRQDFQNIQICNEEPWQQQHWKSITSAYRSSPYFEFYEDEIYPFFHRPHAKLMALNLSLIKKVFELLDVKVNYSFVSFDPKIHTWEGALIAARTKSTIETPTYKQVFGEKHGFISNLSVIDLLFNIGPDSREYLLDYGKHFSANR